MARPRTPAKPTPIAKCFCTAEDYRDAIRRIRGCPLNGFDAGIERSRRPLRVSAFGRRLPGSIGCPHGAGHGEPAEDLAGVDFPQSILLGGRLRPSGSAASSVSARGRHWRPRRRQGCAWDRPGGCRMLLRRRSSTYGRRGCRGPVSPRTSTRCRCPRRWPADSGTQAPPATRHWLSSVTGHGYLPMAL